MFCVKNYAHYARSYIPLLLLLSARGCPWSGSDEQTEYTAINAKVLKLFENFGEIHHNVSV